MALRPGYLSEPTGETKMRAAMKTARQGSTCYENKPRSLPGSVKERMTAATLSGGIALCGP